MAPCVDSYLFLCSIFAYYWEIKGKKLELSLKLLTVYSMMLKTNAVRENYYVFADYLYNGGVHIDVNGQKNSKMDSNIRSSY